MKNYEALRKQVKELIGSNQTGKAFDLLDQEQLPASFERKIIILKNRFAKVNDDLMLGVTDDQSAQLKINQINLALVDLADRLGNNGKRSSSAFPGKLTSKKWWVLTPLLLATAGLILIFVWPNDPSCEDGLHNQDETGIDCGGAYCDPCPETCDDGLRNQDETGIDCGGTYCDPCPETCEDGLRNQDETGIDCGGTRCNPCPVIEYAVIGTLEDLFGNTMANEPVQLSSRGESTIDRVTKTDEGGMFRFAELEKSNSYDLRYQYDTIYKEVRETYTLNGEDTIQASLIYDPIHRHEIHLCTKIVDREPIGKLDGSSGRLDIALNSLGKSTMDSIPTIWCHLRLYGPNKYSINLEDKEKPLFLEWECIDSKNKYVQIVEKPAYFSESGYRDWAPKKIWKGHWKLKIRIGTEVIEQFVFYIT